MLHPVEDQPSRAPVVVRLILFAVLVGIIGSALFWQRDASWIQSLLSQQTHLVGLLQAHPLPMLAGGFAIYVLVTGLSLPGAAILTLFFSYLLQQTWPGARGARAHLMSVVPARPMACNNSVSWVPPTRYTVQH